MNKPESHKKYNRGWFFPVAVVNLYLEKIINAEEMALLGIINVYQDPMIGCWASNFYLGMEWGKSIKHVSRSIALFEKLGLVEIKRGFDVETNLPWRHVFILFQGDKWSKNHPSEPSAKMSTPLRKNV